ncbi:hypothetical protein ACFSO7_16595 [Bacillus sp. CGMCC 1.16607]|uniref:hypothetical protein n=1 Tax=Bacillus sp. CGMCC 1.16607 TaxID=3351842 RepID=UPI00363A9F97
MKWKPDRLLHATLIYIILSGITFWLPLIRGLLDGKSYSWQGWMGIGGAGVGGDYWILLILTSGLIAVVFTGWRGSRKPFYWLLIIWFFLLVIESGSLFFSSEIIYFKGDTLGVNLAIGKVIFPIDVLFFLLSIFWIIRDRKTALYQHRPPWLKINSWLMILFFFLLPLQFIFLRLFDLYKIFDQIGVFLTVFQWFLLNLSFYPWEKK